MFTKVISILLVHLLGLCGPDWKYEELNDMLILSESTLDRCEDKLATMKAQDMLFTSYNNKNYVCKKCEGVYRR